MTPKIYACKDALVMVLKQHSIEKPIKGAELAEAIGLSYVNMRELAAYLTCQGLPIGAHTPDGYYWATAPEHMDPKITQLEGRIVGAAAHLKGARKARRSLERTAAVRRGQTEMELLCTPKESRSTTERSTHASGCSASYTLRSA